MHRRLIALLVLAVLAACAKPSSASAQDPTPSQTPLSTPTPRKVPSAVAIATPVATRTSKPAVTPTVEPTATPTTSPVAAVTPAAAPTATFLSVRIASVPTPATLIPDSPPQIESVMLSEHVMHSGDVVIERVIASSNTASVESRIGGYSLSLPKVGTGLFEVSYKVPFLPFFMHGSYQVVVIARNTAGKQSRRLVPILVQ